MMARRHQKTYKWNGKFIFPDVEAAGYTDFQLVLVRVRIHAALRYVKFFRTVSFVFAADA